MAAGVLETGGVGVVVVSYISETKRGKYISSIWKKNCINLQNRRYSPCSGMLPLTMWARRSENAMVPTKFLGVRESNNFFPTTTARGPEIYKHWHCPSHILHTQTVKVNRILRGVRVYGTRFVVIYINLVRFYSKYPECRSLSPHSLLIRPQLANSLPLRVFTRTLSLAERCQPNIDQSDLRVSTALVLLCVCVFVRFAHSATASLYCSSQSAPAARPATELPSPTVLTTYIYTHTHKHAHTLTHICSVCKTPASRSS